MNRLIKVYYTFITIIKWSYNSSDDEEKNKTRFLGRLLPHSELPFFLVMETITDTALAMVTVMPVTVLALAMDMVVTVVMVKVTTMDTVGTVDTVDTADTVDTVDIMVPDRPPILTTLLIQAQPSKGN